MYHVVINPAASSGKGAKIWDEVKAILDENEVAYAEHLLSRAGEATELVNKLTSNIADGEECNLLVLGGDGTLNEVLNGIDDFERTTLSVIRNGSGNDFARNMKIEKNVRLAVEHLIYELEETVIDFGHVSTDKEEDGRRFLISSGLGYDADICDEVSRSKLKNFLNKIKLGKLVYVMIGIKQVFSKNSCKAILELDGKQAKLTGLFFVVGMMHTYEGGGVPFCPGADPTDGMMDVCLVRDMPKLKILLAICMVYMKKHTMFKNITTHKCKTMTVKTIKPRWIHMDGEAPYQTKEVSWSIGGTLRFVK